MLDQNEPQERSQSSGRVRRSPREFYSECGDVRAAEL